MTSYPFHGYRAPRGQRRVPLSRLHEGRFGRLFRKLRPAFDPELDLEGVFEQLAGQMLDQPAAPDQPGGWGSPGAPPDTGDNDAIASGYTYFGQFVDHDITFDPVSQLQRRNDPDALHDFRSPRFDLDSLYGSGPADEPFQYDRGSDNAKLLIGSNEGGEADLPRNSQDVALIGDPRNDENIIVSQLQLVFLKAHNRFVDLVSQGAAVAEESRFDEAQRLLRWHYQWIVVHDFLPRLVGGDLVSELFEFPELGLPEFKLRYYRPKENAYMPVEFSAAGFRFGHSQIRPAYHLNDVVRDRPIFLPGEVGEFDDLRGFRGLPSQWSIDWKMFLVIGGSTPQPSRLIDTRLAAGLFSLPQSERSLALRNLLRGQALGLPSGQDVAELIGAELLTPAELGTDLVPTPLWFYILKEAEVRHSGQQLGAVGGRIVAEVLLGLLQLDPHSWVNQQPSWRPSIPQAGDELTLADLVVFATS